jgi:Skp family chaperone for outer membrane proteins
MKLWLLLVVVTLSAASVCAQATAPAPAAPQPAAVPRSKIAVIFSEAFQDPKAGIARFIATITKLNAEFMPLENELRQTAQRLKAMQEEIQKMQQGTTPATPQQVQAKIDQYDQQKKAYDRKVEDTRRDYGNRRTQLLLPLQEDVGKALDAFGKAYGLTLILDGSQVPILYATDSMDITAAFIADYNRKNPVTAAVTTPK